MLCSWCGADKAARLVYLGNVIKPACNRCTWRLQLAIRFDGKPMAQLPHRRERGKHGRR